MVLLVILLFSLIRITWQNWAFPGIGSGNRQLLIQGKVSCRLFRGYGRKSLFTHSLQGLTLQTLLGSTLTTIQLDMADIRIIILSVLIEFRQQCGILGSESLPLLSKVPKAADTWTHSWLKIHFLESQGECLAVGYRSSD